MTLSIPQKQIENAYRKQRLHHSTMFAGANDDVKWMTLLHLARLVLCLNPKESKACGQCKSCELLKGSIKEIVLGNKANNHPDLHVVKSADDSNFILVEDIRQVQLLAESSSLLSPNKFIIIYQAERLNKSASNCLLKTLEEPMSKTYFTLMVKSPLDMLDTISSRSQVIHFSEAAPKPKGAVSESQAQAYDIVKNKAWNKINPFLTEYAQLNGKKVTAGQKRQLACDCLDDLICALRDELLIALGCNNELLFWANNPTTSSTHDFADILQYQSILTEAKKNIMANGKIDLICQTIIIQFQRI